MYCLVRQGKATPAPHFRSMVHQRPSRNGTGSADIPKGGDTCPLGFPRCHPDVTNCDPVQSHSHLLHALHRCKVTRLQDHYHHNTHTVMSAPKTPTTAGVAASQVKAISTVAWQIATTNKLPRELLNNHVSSTLPVSKLNTHPAMPARSCSRSPPGLNGNPSKHTSALCMRCDTMHCTKRSGAVLAPITTTNQREP